ncbi:MAG: hypothetical protein LBD02_06145 [Christensenellaceae bacterium]|nr:hypothetical protein [Christensenellaceae bacterium]
MPSSLQAFAASLAELPWIWAALTLFGCGALQCSLPVFPGDILLLIAAGLSSGRPVAGLYTLLLPYWLGSASSSVLVSEIGRKFGSWLTARPLFHRLFPVSAQERSQNWLKKRGALTILSAKFLFGLNVPTLLFAGILRMPRRRVVPAAIFTTLLHNSLFYLLGAVLGLNWEGLSYLAQRYSVFVGALLALLLGLAYWLRKRAGKDCE